MTLYQKPRDDVFASSAPPSEIQPFSAWGRGLGIAFEETNGFPEMTGLNGLFNSLNIYIKYLEQNGLSEWSSTMEYPVGAGVRAGAEWYKAKTQNTNKPPATSQSDWELLLNASSLTYQDPVYVENNVIKIRDSSTTQKGVVQFANPTEVANKQNVSKVITPANVATIAQSTDLGVGQSYFDFTSIRSVNSEYTNTTGKPILVIITQSSDSNPSIVVDNVVVTTIDGSPGSVGVSASVIVPHLSKIRVTASFSKWVELR